MEDKIKIRKFFARFALVFITCVLIFVWLIGNMLYQKGIEQTNKVSPAQLTAPLAPGDILSQSFTFSSQNLDSLSFIFSHTAAPSPGVITLSLMDGEDVLSTQDVALNDLPEGVEYTFHFAPVSVSEDRPIRMLLSVSGIENGNTVCVYWGNTIRTARAEIDSNITAENYATFNGQQMEGSLCFNSTGLNNRLLGYIFWPSVALILCLIGVWYIHTLRRAAKGKSCFVLQFYHVIKHYRFLLEQLVARDFKTKYKRSILGMFWSVLNPVLTMAVQYIIFSTLFKSDIENFGLYLLCGIVCFNFFNESVGMALTSIVGNASLITKVYVPKYIYPVSRVCSSTINLLIAFIPLLIAQIISHTPFTKALLALPYGVVCLFVFCLGMSFFLSAAMVFFRDTQFLWGVISMLWMYATPIFYPSTIIPEAIMPIYKLNPLYQIITYFRIILMDGLSPDPSTYLYCFLCSIIPFIVGFIVFKKTQDRFVLYI